MIKFLLVVIFAPLIYGVTIRLENNQKSPVTKEVTLGQTDRLTCTYQATGTPPGQPVIEWKYLEKYDSNEMYLVYYQQKIQPEFIDKIKFIPPASLEIMKASKSTTGFYEVSVTWTGDRPPVVSGAYNVTVIIPPSKPVCRYTNDYALTLGFREEFQCQSSEGVPSPTYTWYKNGNPLPPSSQGNNALLNTSYSYNPSTGTLVFSKVTKADEGSYFCQASNKVGKAECMAANITTKDQDIGMIVGIVFGCVFGVLLIGILVWWTWKRGYCDGFSGKDEDYEYEGDAEDANDIMLDGNGPMVNKPSSEYNGSVGRQEASMMI